MRVSQRECVLVRVSGWQAEGAGVVCVDGGQKECVSARVNGWRRPEGERVRASQVLRG